LVYILWENMWWCFSESGLFHLTSWFLALFSCKCHNFILYGWIMYLYNFIYNLYFILYGWNIFIIFLIHSSVNGHLGWIHNLAIMNSATVNMSVQVSQFYADFPLGTCPRMV
jgi:hypothetical protein